MGQLKTSGNRRRALRVAFIVIAMLLLMVGVVYAAVITVVDDGGADDYPGQKDLNQLTVETPTCPRPSPSHGTGIHGVDG